MSIIFHPNEVIRESKVIASYRISEHNRSFPISNSPSIHGISNRIEGPVQNLRPTKKELTQEKNIQTPKQQKDNPNLSLSNKIAPVISIKDSLGFNTKLSTGQQQTPEGQNNNKDKEVKIDEKVEDKEVKFEDKEVKFKDQPEVTLKDKDKVKQPPLRQGTRKPVFTDGQQRRSEDKRISNNNDDVYQVNQIKDDSTPNNSAISRKDTKFIFLREDQMSCCEKLSFKLKKCFCISFAKIIGDKKIIKEQKKRERMTRVRPNIVDEKKAADIQKFVDGIISENPQLQKLAKNNVRSMADIGNPSADNRKGKKSSVIFLSNKKRT